MAIRDLTAKIRITVDSSGAVTGIRAVDNELDKLDDSIKDTDESTSTLGGTFTKFSVGAVAAWAAVRTAAAAATTAIELFRESTVRAGQERGLEIQLARSGAAIDDFLQKIDEVSLGQLSRAEQISSSSRAIALGLEADILPTLLDIATKASAVFGEPVEKLFSDLTEGIAKVSPELLNNLGIIVKADEAYREYADANGLVVEQLTAVERQQAITAKAIEAGTEQFSDLGEAISGAAIAAASLSANFADLSDKAADSVAQSSVLEDVLNRLNASLFDDENSLRAVIASQEAYLQNTRGLTDEIRENIQIQIDANKAKLAAVEATEELTAAEVAESKIRQIRIDQLEEEKKALEELNAAQKAQEDALESLGVTLESDLQIQIEQQEALKETALQLVLNGDITEGTYARAIEAADAEISKLTDEINEGYTPAVQKNTVAVLEATEAEEGRVGVVQEAGQKTEDVKVATDNYTESLRKLVEQQLAAVAAGEILNGTLTLGGTRVTFGTVRDPITGEIIQSAGSRLVVSDGNGGYTLRSGGGFTTVGAGIPENFSSFGFD